MNKNLMETIEGIKLQDGFILNKLIVTGRLYNSNKRFKNIYAANKEGWEAVMMINIWNGSIWGLNQYGKRKLLKRVNN